MFRSSSMFLLLLSSARAFCQAEANPPSFEVVDVRVNKSGDIRMAVDMQGGGAFTMRNVPMRTMIVIAYRVRPDAVTGGPGWLDSDRFDVVAKAGQTTPPDDLRRMLQTLLAERFKLVVHTAQRMMPVFVLALGKSAVKLRTSEAAPLSEQRCIPGEGKLGSKHINCRHITMAMLAGQLQEQSPRDLDAAVVDQTGLEGFFDFQLDWTPAARTAVDPSAPMAGPTVFEAVETQLGLKLESKRLLMPVIVVDRVERGPVEN
jgi:uncharacterized protein (TIGR03435 family)